MKLTRKEYTDPAEKKKDFWRGFWGWWLGNGALWIVTAGVTAAILAAYGDNTSLNAILDTASIVVNLLPLLINALLLIYFALTRSQIALGMLVAFAVGLGIVVILGIILTVACFVILATSKV
jgi:hypothetical protein